MATQATSPKKDERLVNAHDTATILKYLEAAKALFREQVNTVTPAERRRFASMGIKRAGFVRKAFELWRVNEQFAPGYVSTEEMEELNASFDHYVQIVTTAQEVIDLATDARIAYSSELFRFALSFYDNVKQAATISRMPEALAIFRTLNPFFKRGSRTTANGGEPTEKQLLKDAKALIKGKKDGKLLLENEIPHAEHGKHVVIDEMGKIHEKGKIIEAFDKTEE